MEIQDLISINQLCTTYQVEISFINELNDLGLIEVITIEEIQYLHKDNLTDMERMIRMHHELDINLEGIDVVCNLLKKVDDLQNELIVVKNKLRLYED